MNQEEDDAVVRFAVWTALRPESANLTQFDLLEAKNVDEGVAVTSAWFGPSQNVVMADASGRIGWTISGFIPKRLGFDGSTPVPWSADCRWDWGSQAPRPSLVDPESGVLFTANNRVAGLGIRARHRRELGSWLPSLTHSRPAGPKASAR